MGIEDDHERLLKASTLRRSNALLARRLRVLRADHGLPASKLSLLGWLERSQRPLTASQLAELEHLQPQSLTRTIAELDAEGLIQRRENAADRRQLLIEITPKGHDLIFEDARRQTVWLAKALQKLTRAEADVLMIAARLIEQLAAQEPSAAGPPASEPEGGPDTGVCAQDLPPEGRPDSERGG